MLWPHEIPGDWDETEQLPKEWHNLADLLDAGRRAVKDVSHETKTVIHIDTGGDAAFSAKWLRAFFKLGGQCDVIGLSWYPMWHGTVDDLVENINSLTKKFPKQDV